MQDTLNAFKGDLFRQVAALPDDWKKVFQPIGIQTALSRLDLFLQEELNAGVPIYPAYPFRALTETPASDVQVVILGQDPYHGPGQAHGLAFSVPASCPTPPSLRNIFTELALEYPNDIINQSNDLSRWARQGVLLLNTTLTVEGGKAGSHAGRGWESITDALMERVLLEPSPKVFMLWGNHARAKKSLILQQAQAGSVLVLESNHPSPLSARRPPIPFIGCGHFVAANKWLLARGRHGIDWLAPR